MSKWTMEVTITELSVPPASNSSTSQQDLKAVWSIYDDGISGRRTTVSIKPLLSLGQ